MTEQVIGTLQALFDLQTQSFNAAISGAADKVGSAQAKINRSLAAIESGFASVDRSFQSAGRSLAVFAGGYLSVQFVRSAINAGDRLNDLSRQTGVSVETLSRLSLAAAQSGTDIESVAASINRLQRNLSVANTDGKEAAKAFTQMGLSIAELRSMSPEQQFLKIAERINEFGDQADRTRLLIDIFGKSGASLGPMFAEGSEGIRAAMDQAERLGLILDKESAQDLDEFNDRWEAFVQKCERLAQLSFVGVSDFIEKVAGRLSAAMDPMAANTLDQVETAIRILERRRDQMLNTESGSEYDAEELEKYYAQLKRIDGELETLYKKRKDFEQAPAGSSTPSKGGRTLASGPDTEAIKQHKKELEEAKRVYDDTRTAAERYAMQVDKLDQMLLYGNIDQDTYNRGLKKAEEEYKKADEASRRLAETGRELGLTFASSFEDAFAEGKKFGDLLSSLEQDIKRLVIRKGFTEPVLERGIGSFFESSFASFFGGARAGGGSVKAGKFYQVNEYGQEFFAPGQDGAILNSSQIATAGSPGVTLNIINNTPSRISSSSNESGNGTELTVMIDQAVANNIRRQGSQTNQALEAHNSRTLIRR